jgi:DNA-directed RNA polymerase subunit RPC12/RpoP
MPTPPDLPPEEHEPVVTKAPPEGRKFPCVKCGAKLDFDPSSRALQCPYCGYKQEIEPSNQALEEKDFEELLAKGEGEGGKVLEGRSTQVKCSACNAIVLLEDKVVTDKCPYCSSHLENKPVAAEAMIVPEGVVPFAVNNRGGIDAFARWVAGLWFAPNALKKFALLGQMNGVYVPFWTFDSMTYSHYTGLRGINVPVQETYTETNPDGTTSTKTRTVIQIQWFPVAGEVDHFFDDVLICASKGIPEYYARHLPPRDLKSLEAFRPEFLSGFKTERYTIGPKDGFNMAKQIMDREIHELCRRAIGGDHQQVTSVKTQHVGITYKHILLPLWLASYRYHDKTFRVMVNGLTGAVQGDRPYSWVKITALVLAILAGVLALFLLFKEVAKGAEQSGPRISRIDTNSLGEQENRDRRRHVHAATLARIRKATNPGGVVVRGCA